MTRIISIVGGLQPSAPTIGTATAGDTTASIAFTPSSYIGKGTITYTATSSPGGLTGTASSSPITVTGLTNGTAYTFTVTGTTNYGVTSIASAASNSITPALGDTGSMFPIGAVTVPSAGAATITFSSIPSTYKHLQIRLIARSGRSDGDAAAGGIYIQLNSNFLTAQHQLRGNGSSISASGSSGGLTNGTIIIWVPATGASAGIFGAGIVDILDYANTNKTKVVRILGGDDLNGSGYLAMTSGLWNSTSAITSITFGSTDGVGNIPQYSSFALYGIKGA